MTKPNSYRAENVGVLLEQRSRILVAIRKMLVPAGSHGAAGPLLLMSGDGFEMARLLLASDLAKEGETDVIYVEFEPGHAVLRPRSIIVVVVRDGITHLVRNCDLWVSKTGDACALVPAKSVGHLVYEEGELVHLPGKPGAPPAAGIARARIAATELAATVPEEEARRYFSQLVPNAA